MEAVLKKTNDVLLTEGLAEKVWLIGGAVLGFRRERRLIEHDRDLDFGILEKDVDLFLDKVENLLNHGFKKAHRWVNNDGYATEYSFRLDGVKVEFFVHYEKEHEVYWYAYHGGKKVQLLWRMQRYSCYSYEFLGMTWRMPRNLEQYLVLQHGKDWMTPNPNYNYITDCPANIETTIWKGRNSWPNTTVKEGFRNECSK